MKIVAIVLFTVLLSACASMMGYHFEPKTMADAASLITYEVDEFEGDAWLKTESVANMEHPSEVV